MTGGPELSVGEGMRRWASGFQRELRRVKWARPREREGEGNSLFIFQTNFQNPFQFEILKQTSFAQYHTSHK
jgi:hypothetical protein